MPMHDLYSQWMKVAMQVEICPVYMSKHKIPMCILMNTLNQKYYLGESACIAITNLLPGMSHVLE